MGFSQGLLVVFECACMHTCMNMHMCIHAHTCGGQGTAFGSRLSLSTLWILGIELRSSGSAASALLAEQPCPLLLGFCFCLCLLLVCFIFSLANTVLKISILFTYTLPHRRVGVSYIPAMPLLCLFWKLSSRGSVCSTWSSMVSVTDAVLLQSFTLGSTSLHTCPLIWCRWWLVKGVKVSWPTKSLAQVL